MDYVDWVNEVMRGFVKAWQESDANAKLVGISIHEIVQALGFKIDTRTPDFDRTKLAEAVRDALRDLDRMGLIEEDYRYYLLTQEGIKFPVADLSTAWPQIMRIHLDDDQEAFLKKVSEIGQEVFDTHVCVKDLTAQQIFTGLGWPWDDDGTAKGYLITQQLQEIGMIQRNATMGGHIGVIPTYVGITRTTREAETEWSKLVKQLVDDWETTNVDFKRELNLNNDREKAEFVRDILSLATTKSSGRRFLVVGFDNNTRLFVKSVDSNITQERLEQILYAYSEPTPQIKYHAVSWASGTIGIVEIFRNPKEIPYAVKKDIGGKNGIKVGDIFVRHGSHTESPTPRELDDLKKESAH